MREIFVIAVTTDPILK